MYTPPKTSLNFLDYQKLLDVAWNSGFIDWHELSNFLEIQSNLLGNSTISEIIIQKTQDVISKTPAKILIDLLQAQYFAFGQNSQGGFLLWVGLYLHAKQKYPEMLAFAYPKLITQRGLMDKIKAIVLEMVTQKGDEELKYRAEKWQEIL